MGMEDGQFDLVVKVRFGLFSFVVFEDGEGNGLPHPSYIPEKFKDENLHETENNPNYIQELVELVKSHGWEHDPKDVACAYDGEMFAYGFSKKSEEKEIIIAMEKIFYEDPSLLDVTIKRLRRLRSYANMLVEAAETAKETRVWQEQCAERRRKEEEQRESNDKQNKG